MSRAALTERDDMSVVPTSQRLTDGQSQQFSMVDAGGAPVVPAGGAAITWAVTPVAGAGTINADGLFTAPLVVSAEAQVAVTATLPGGNPEGAVVRLVPLEIILVPTMVSLREGE